MFYDCFVPMAPIMLALTANCPAFRGWLVDTDCRWDIISASVDSRRDEELPAWRSRAFGDKDEEELDQVNDAVRSNHLNGSEKSGNGLKNVYEGSGKRIHDKLDPNDDSREKGNVNVEKIPARRTGEKIGESGGSYYGRMGKSRYGSVSLYIGNSNKFNEKYNDVDVNVNTWVYNKLQKAGFDNVLARHFAHLFIQDPLVVYRGKVQMDDATHTDHFENIQSTNWQTVRFKPPPPNSGIGWRVEFRSMELQFHDFENAAYVIFIALITRVLTQFQLNLYMPISAVDANMARAQRRNAVLDQRFYWRKNLLGTNAAQSADDSMVELTVNEIINGSQASGFIGLIPLVNRYLDTKLTSPEVKEKIGVYLQFISDRASGKLLTGAAFQRRFILNHPLYKRDSRLTNEIAYDLLKEVQKVQASENPLSFYKA
jgi:glutamate--cysteine ligase catalytic subunit